MKKAKSVLAFDLGASGGRAVLGTLSEGRIVMEEVHRFSNDPVTVNDTMYWDTLRQFYEMKQGLIKAKQIRDFVSIGIDAWGVDFGLIDAHGDLMENAVHYRDKRTDGMFEAVFAKISKDRLYEITGNEFAYFNTIFQMNALLTRRPWILERADKFLFTPDLFNYFLTGQMKSEYTMASTSSLMDIRSHQWSEEIIEAIGLPRRIFGEIVESGTVIGSLKPEICEELGISSKQVIAVASHDTQSASAAVPAQEDDFIFISCGTWCPYGTELTKAANHRTSMELNITNEGGYGGKINFLKNVTGLWIIQECRRQWIREGKEYSFAELEVLASRAEPLKSYIDADAPQFIAAGNMPERIRTFCRETGQPVPETVGEIVCCINQSLALKFRCIRERIEACLNKKYPKIYMIGGGIRSQMLCQMTADANGCPVQAGPVEATALGNLAVQLIALGEIKDIKEARSIIERSEESCCYQPESPVQWSQAYEQYKKILK